MIRQGTYNAFSIPHYPDCDNAYPDSLVENFVCNEAEDHGIMDATRKCLQEQKANDVGFITRHLDCWEQAIKGNR